MKKIYQIPEVTVVKMKTIRMIATSETVSIGSYYNGEDVIESRQGDGFFDDEE